MNLNKLFDDYFEEQKEQKNTNTKISELKISETIIFFFINHSSEFNYIFKIIILIVLVNFFSHL